MEKSLGVENILTKVRLSIASIIGFIIMIMVFLIMLDQQERSGGKDGENILH